MGLSSSQARLLTITARLTSNEYESQQISNAKMRLATQSEQASSEYISALNSQKLLFTTYDAQGSPVTEALTANALYSYSDLKNQYALINASGQMILASGDAKNFEESSNLSEFLTKYGLTKVYKSETLQQNAQILESDEYQGYYAAWEDAINKVKNSKFSGSYTDEDGINQTYTDVESDRAYEIEKSVAYRTYINALADYQDAVLQYNAGVSVDVNRYLEEMSAAKVAYSDTITYDNWLMSKAAYETHTETASDGSVISVRSETEEYNNVMKYYAVLEEMNAEATNLGCTSLEDMYVYSDEAKARWYTNLWYRLNGESTDKSAQGNNKSNYEALDSKLASSSTWLQDALSQGIISIEAATYMETPNLIPDLNRPLTLQLKGITWSAKEYTSCTDFTREDDDKAIARAEAEYNRKNNEITAKDKKYENKIKVLDTEHNALQTEYESVQSAMNKNIERSFKAFS